QGYAGGHLVVPTESPSHSLTGLHVKGAAIAAESGDLFGEWIGNGIGAVSDEFVFVFAVRESERVEVDLPPSWLASQRGQRFETPGERIEFVSLREGRETYLHLLGGRSWDSQQSCVR